MRIVRIVRIVRIARIVRIVSTVARGPSAWSLCAVRDSLKTLTCRVAAAVARTGHRPCRSKHVSVVYYCLRICLRWWLRGGRGVRSLAREENFSELKPPCPPQIHVHVFHRRDPEVLIRRWASCLDHGVAVPRNRPEETRFRERKRNGETWCIAKYASARRMWRLTTSAGSPAVSSAAAVRVEFSEGHRQCSDRHSRSRSRSPPCATTYPRAYSLTRLSLGSPVCSLGRPVVLAGCDVSERLCRRVHGGRAVCERVWRGPRHWTVRMVDSLIR